MKLLGEVQKVNEIIGMGMITKTSKIGGIDQVKLNLKDQTLTQLKKPSKFLIIGNLLEVQKLNNGGKNIWIFVVYL